MHQSKTLDEPCPYERILQYASNISKFFVKLRGKKYSDSIYLTEKEICKYPEGKHLLHRFLKRKKELTDCVPYDPIYDKIDTILAQKDNKYLILWCGLGFDQLTWEVDVDHKKVHLFRKRLKQQFPSKNEDVTNFPKISFEIPSAIKKNLISAEQITLKKILISFNQRTDFITKENMGIDAMNACLSFLKILQNSEHYGPFLIVSDKNWYEKLRDLPDMLPIYYRGNEKSCEKLNELFFNDDSTEAKFHVLIITPKLFERNIQIISKIHYKAAIFNSESARFLYKKYSQLIVGMSICVETIDPSRSARQIDNLASALMTKDSTREISSDDSKRIQDIKTKIQPSLQKKKKSSDGEFISPPIISIDCPLSQIQKEICKSVLIEYKSKPSSCIEKVLRICSHAFLTDFGEYDLGSPNLIEASTKLKVFLSILDKCRENSETVLVISQYQQIIGYIIDVLEDRGATYVELSSDFKDVITPVDAPSVYLYNPKYLKNLPPIECIQSVVIFDGRNSVWTGLLKNYRNSRNNLFNINKVYHLECNGCCENELLDLSELLKPFDNKLKTCLNFVAIHSFSSFDPPSPKTLIRSGIRNQQTSVKSIISPFIDSSHFSVELNGEIIKGQPPETKINIDDEFEYAWSIHERNLLTRGLFQIGLDRIEALQRIVGLYLPKNVIEKIIPSLLAELLKYSSASCAYNIVKSYIRKCEDSGPLKRISEIPCFNDLLYWNNLRPKASDLLKRLEMLSFLNISFGGHKELELKPEQVPFFRYGGGSPHEWWTESYDQALAYLTWRFGFGCFDHYEEYKDSNPFCSLIAHMPDVIEYKRLTDRSLKLCEVAKRISFSDQRVIEEVSKIPSKWSQEIQKIIITYLLQYGILEDDDGSKDYDTFADELDQPNLDGPELEEYVNDLLKICKNPETQEIQPSMAQRILQRINGMATLRKLLRDKNFIQKLETAQHWRTLPRNWTPEVEKSYFEKVERHGFGHLHAIFDNSEFSTLFKTQVPSFLMTDDDVIRRINILSENTPPQSRKAPIDPHSAFIPSKPIQKPTSSGNAITPATPKKPKKVKSTTPASVKKIVVTRLKELQKGVKFPLAVTQFTSILSLGKIVTDRPGFHNERYIFPAGYKATRLFSDFHNPDGDKIEWISEIIDTGKDKPIFKIYPADRPKESLEGETPSAPWVMALKKLSHIRNEKGKANTISGPEAYLLSHPVTIYLIQHMPKAEECTNYIMKPIVGEDGEPEEKHMFI